MSALELAERALRAATGEALAHVTRERSLMLRFAAGRPTQATAIDDVTVELAVVRDGHVGRAATNSSADGTLEACARRASAAAEAAAAVTAAGAGAGALASTAGAAAAGAPAAGAPPGRHPGFPPPRHTRRHEGHDAETARLDAAPGFAALAAAATVGARRGVEAHGIWSVAEQERAVATLAGVALADRTTDAYMKVICIAPDGRSGYAARTAVSAAALEPEALTERAAAKATAPGEPAELPPGEYPVVMEPHAVGELLEQFAQTALNGLAHAEGRGALVDRLDRQVAAPAVNLADSPRSPATLPRSFDAEGVPKDPMPLIQDGVAVGVAHDLRSAAMAGAKSTGHALVPGGDSHGPYPVNLVLGGGGAADLEELCAPIERGIYVTRLWYANVVRPKETLVTAVTRDGTFLIEDGRVTRPLRDLRLTDSVLGILSRVQALTARQELVSDGEFYGRRLARGVVCPALRAGAVRFTDAAG